MLINVIIIVFGLLAIFMAKKVTRQKSEFNKKLFKLDTSQNEAKYGERIGIIVGIFLIVIGVLGLLGVLPNR